jgi:hypothetical protein
MQLNRTALGVLTILSGFMAIYLGVKSGSLYHREWSLRQSHAVVSAVAVEVSSNKARGGCSTNVRFEFEPTGSPVTYATSNEFLNTEDPDCVNVNWTVGGTMEFAYVPDNPKIHRPIFFGRLDRGIGPHEWVISAVGAFFCMLAFVFLIWFRHTVTSDAQETFN